MVTGDRKRDLEGFALRLEGLVSKAANDADPVGLLEGGAPEDEYSGVVDRIVAQIVNRWRKPRSQELTDICQSVFIHGFGEDTTMRKDAFHTMSHQIIEGWDAISPPHPFDD